MSLIIPILMKAKNPTLYFTFLLIVLLSLKIQAQQNPLDYKVELNAGVESEATLPFWITTNKFGSIPKENYGFLKGVLFKDFLPNNVGRFIRIIKFGKF